MSRQVGEMLGRLTGSEMLKMRVPGVIDPVVIPTRALVFAPDDRWLVGASRSLTGHEDYAFVSTGQGGYAETYMRIDLMMDMTPIDTLSGLMFRADVR